MNPLLLTFLRITAVIAIAIIGLILAAFILKIVVIAAVIAAVVLGGFFIYSLVRRRGNAPVIR